MRIPDNDVIESLQRCLKDLAEIRNRGTLSGSLAYVGRIERRLKAIVHTLELPDLPAPPGR